MFVVPAAPRGRVSRDVSKASARLHKQTVTQCVGTNAGYGRTQTQGETDAAACVNSRGLLLENGEM